MQSMQSMPMSMQDANQQEVVQSGPIIQAGTPEDTFADEVLQ